MLRVPSGSLSIATSCCICNFRFDASCSRSAYVGSVAGPRLFVGKGGNERKFRKEGSFGLRHSAPNSKTVLSRVRDELKTYSG